VNLARLISPREQKQNQLFLKLVHAVANEHIETIAGACINLLITVVHRMNVKQGDAEARWDDLFGQGKELLRARFKEQQEKILRAS
jgi:hypothetical protein